MSNQYTTSIDEWLPEYKKLLKSKDIILLDIPVNKKSKPRHSCLVCEHVWRPTISNVIRGGRTGNGSGCPVCGIEIIRRTIIDNARKTFDKRLLSKTTQFKRISEYTDGKTPIEFLCTKCNTSFMKKPTGFLQRPRCSNCYTSKRGRLVSNSAEEKFRNVCKDEGITVLGTYKGTAKKISLSCSKGHEWVTWPHYIVSGGGCPTCSSYSSFRFKTLNVDGVAFQIQGYEDIALHLMIREKKVDPNEIIWGRTEVQQFRYKDSDGELRKYYPDFQVGKRIIEVKSTWTIGLTGSPNNLFKLQRKAKQVRKQGFIFSLLLIKPIGKTGRVFVAKFKKDWINLSLKEFERNLMWKEITAYIPQELIVHRYQRHDR